MKKYSDKPFVLLGVNSWPRKPGELGEVMTREKISWRTFDDREGKIARAWNAPATPAFFLIDHEGRIRRKWIGKPGEESVEEIVETLVGKAGVGVR